MPRRTARGNRIGLAIVGFVLLAAGAVALARGSGLSQHVFGDPHAAVTDRPVRDFADDHLWFWIALAAAATVIALLALRWLAVQARTDALRSIRLEPDSRQGTTMLPARALTSALDDDLADSAYLRRATAMLTGSSARPRLSLTVTLEPNADPSAAKHRIDQALDRARQAMQVSDLPTVVHIRTSR